MSDKAEHKEMTYKEFLNQKGLSMEEMFNVAIAAFEAFEECCLEVANANWSKEQVRMLERLFEALKRGCEYKCVDCEYCGKPFDTPDDVADGCMYEVNRQQDETGAYIDKLSCEEDWLSAFYLRGGMKYDI